MNIHFGKVVPDPLKDALSEATFWGVEHTFEKGATYLVNAPSGKGKSTLLSYIYGLRNDYTGKVMFDGRDVSVFSVDDWAECRKMKLSMMFQDLRLFDDLTALENIKIKADLNGQYPLKEIESLAEELGVAFLLNKKVKLMSMGQQQRIAFIRCLVQPFNWLLLDEPYSHLDDVNVAIMEQLIVRYCDKNGAGLILTNLGKNLNMTFQHTVSV